MRFCGKTHSSCIDRKRYSAMQTASRIFSVLFVVSLSTSVSAQSIWVSGADMIGVYDIASGKEAATFDIPGRTADMHALPNGHVVLNYRAKAELVLFDAKARREVGRIPSSKLGGINPHHGYVLKTANAHLYAVVHDGENAEKDSTLSLFRITQATLGLEYAGEIRLGAGHHKIAHAPGQNWISASNINDCENVVQIIDIADPATPKTIRKVSAKDIGYDASAPDKTCDATGKAGRKLSPHGAGATSAFHAHNLNGTGQMIVVRQNGEAKALATKGTGGASAVATSSGNLYVTQFSPRDGGSGAPCQIGQIAVIGSSGELSGQYPVLKDAGCQDKAAGARLGYVSLAADGETLMLPLGTLGSDAQPAAAIVRAKVTTAGIQQLPSLAVGGAIGHRDHGWNADATLFAFPNNKSNTVSIINARSGKVTQTIAVVPDPLRVAITQP